MRACGYCHKEYPDQKRQTFDGSWATVPPVGTLLCGGDCLAGYLENEFSVELDEVLGDDTESGFDHEEPLTWFPRCG